MASTLNNLPPTRLVTMLSILTLGLLSQLSHADQWQ